MKRNYKFLNQKYLAGFLSIVIVLGSIAYVTRPIAVFSAPNDALKTTVTVNDDVFAIEVTATKIYIGGNFTQVNGQGRNYLAALNLDGTRDDAWNSEVDDAGSAGYPTDTTVDACSNI